MSKETLSTSETKKETPKLVNALEQKYQEEMKVKEKLLKEKFNLDFKLKEKNLEKKLTLKTQNENKAKIQALLSKER